jgi:hypothetical protein
LHIEEFAEKCPLHKILTKGYECQEEYDPIRGKVVTQKVPNEPMQRHIETSLETIKEDDDLVGVGRRELPSLHESPTCELFKC